MTESILKFLIPLKVRDFLTKARLFLKGKKTYIAAAIILLEASLGFLEQVVNIESISAAADWIAALPSNPYSLKAAEALALFGIRAAIATNNK